MWITVHKLVPLLPLIACFSLIYIIQAHKLDSKARNSFLVFLGGMGCWALCSLLIRNAHSLAMATFAGRLARAAITLMGAASLHFVYELLEIKRRRLVYCAYGITLVIIPLVFFTDLIATTAGRNMWGYYGGNGPLKQPCNVFSISIVIYSIILLLRKRSSKDAALRRAANITIIAFSLTIAGGISDILPTLGVPMYPAGMFTQTIFAILVAYGAFEYQLTGVLFRPQPRIVLASITYALIASGIALAFTDSASRIVFVYLLAILFVAFNIYHYFDDLAYLVQKYLGAQLQPYFRKSDDGSSILFNNAEIGILALDTRQKLLFTNTKAAQILGADVIESNSLSALKNDILRKKLEVNIGRRSETIISLDEKTSAEITPIEFGHDYLGTLICFYPKSRGSLQKQRRKSQYARLDLRRIFSRD